MAASNNFCDIDIAILDDIGKKERERKKFLFSAFLDTSSRDRYNASYDSLVASTSTFSTTSPADSLSAAFNSSYASSSSSFNSRAAERSMDLSAQLQIAYYITIALTGLVGNATTIIVFSQRRLRSLRSSFFLTCLAITDLIFILILVVALLDEFQVPVMTIPMCMLTIYLSHIASFLSSNFTLAYTSHRLIAVFFPIKATTFLKQRTNRVLAFGLFLFACVFYSISFPVTKTTFRSNTTNMVFCEEDREKAMLFPFLVLDTLFTFLIPFSLITCMNLAIVYKLHTALDYTFKAPTSTISTPISCPSANSSIHSVSDAIPLSPLNSSKLKASSGTSSPRKNNVKPDANDLLQRQQDRLLLCVRQSQRVRESRPTLSTTSTPSLRNIPLYQGNTSVRIRSSQCRATASAKTTKMLLAASTVFLVFNLPYHLLLFCFLCTQEQPAWMPSAVNIARLWFFASFCVNFFVYVICGQRFRAEVVRLFSCSSIRRSCLSHSPKLSHDRQNSIYFSHRLAPHPSSYLSHSN